MLHFSKGKTSFEVHRNESKDCSSYHFSVILYHASNLKAQVPFERLILIFLPLLIPFSPLAAISSLIQPPMRCNRIVHSAPATQLSEGNSCREKCYTLKAAFILQKVKRPRLTLIWRAALEAAHSPKDVAAQGMQLLELSWGRGAQLRAGGCRYSRDLNQETRALCKDCSSGQF